MEREKISLQAKYLNSENSQTSLGYPALKQAERFDKSITYIFMLILMLPKDHFPYSFVTKLDAYWALKFFQIKVF